MHTRGRTSIRERHDGSISIMAAVLIAAMVMATSLAVDVGRVAYTSRDQQGVTDRAVLDALHQLGDAIPPGATLEQIHPAVAQSVDRTLAGNTEGSSVGTARDRTPVAVEIGYTDPSCVYDPADPQPEDPQDFCVMYSQDGAGPHYGDFDPTPGVGEPVTTVRVVTQSAVDYVFAFLSDDGKRDVVKQALATNNRTWDCPPLPDPCSDAEAGISVRSRLLELDSDNSAILRPLFADLLGMPDPTQLSLAGFDGLADARVPLGVLGDAGANVGSTGQLLDSQVALADLFTAMASGATSDDAAVTADAQTALTELAAEVDPALQVRIGDILTTTTEDPTALLLAEVDTLGLVMDATMAAAIANGNNLVDLGLSGSNLLGLDGLLAVDATLTLIEAPQRAYGKVAWDSATGTYETFAETAQVSIDLDVSLNTYYAETLLGPLENLLTGLLCLLGPLLCPTDTVTVSLAVAEARADLAGIACVDPAAETDITTIVTSDALVATVDGGDDTLVDSRDASTGTVVIPQVPGEGSTTVANTSLTNTAALDAFLEPILALLGIGTGTAYAGAWAVDCEVPVLMPNPLP